MYNLPILEDRAGLHNIAELFQDGAELGFSRIPLALRETLNDNAKLRASFTTCAEIRFNLRGGGATILLRMVEQPALIELYNGTHFAGWHIIGTTPTRVDIAPPMRLDLLRTLYQRHGAAFAPDLYRVLLPWSPEVRLLALDGDIEPPRREQLPAKRYLAYGSSITHGNSGIRPTGMYVQRIAQHLGVDLINLGFGGGAYLEPQFADYIANRDDWDFASLELGINLVNREITEQEFAKRTDYFINTIASAHPDKPLFILDMFPFYGDYDDTLGQRPQRFRAIVRELVQNFAHRQITSIDASTLLTPTSGLQIDVLHPSPQGMEEIGAKLAAIMRLTIH